MATFDDATSRDLILFIGSYQPEQREAVQLLSKQLGRKLRALVLVTETETKPEVAKDPQAIVVMTDFDDVRLTQQLHPYKERLLAMTTRHERHIPLMSKVIPHVPYLHAPTAKSLEWATDKIQMRQLLRAADKSISPKFLVAHEADEFTFNRIEKQVGFPLIIKPAGLAFSMLVSVCYHREELEENLKNTVKRIKAIYKKKQGRGEPQILVEELMEGTMYSIDSYVNDRGVVYHTPPVHVKTGRAIGFDDFFGYQQLTPVKLKAHKIEVANQVVEKAINALNLRSTTTHTELMKTEDGWKIVEVGARMGGYRHEMYELSTGLNHALNDLRIRIPRRPVVPKKTKGYSAILRFYARKRGTLVKVTGLKKARSLESFKRLDQRRQVGDFADFARNGGDPVVDLVLFNSSRPRLLADIRRLEKSIVIETRSTTKKS